jgi:tetratricopeptide (TPR) repeat protein
MSSDARAPEAGTRDGLSGPLVPDAADQVLRQATVEPGRAYRRALELGEHARRGGDARSAAVCAHAAGVAAQQLGRIDDAIEQYRRGIRIAGPAGFVDVAARARASLAGSMLVRGRLAAALREIDGALADLSGVDAARALTQRAAILQLTGRPEDALADLRRAIPALRQAGDADWAAGALSNRSVLHIARRAFAAAEADLVLAGRLAAEHGLTLWSAYIEQNLGWLESNRGEIVNALGHFARSEQLFGQVGTQTGSLLVDRAEMLLSVRLIDEARAAADGAVDLHRRHRDQLHLPRAQLLLSTVALVQRDLAVAARSAEQALGGFGRLGDAGGVALARFARLQARYAIDPAAVTAGRARRAADELRATGWQVPALEARVLAGIIALRRGQLGAARLDLALAARARATGPAEVRIRGWLGEALLRSADGRPTAAHSAIDAGLRIVDRYQATLGATELRAHVSLHRGELARLGLRLAQEAGDARRMLALVERGRASALLFRRPRPPADPALSRDLADLRTTMREIDEARDEGRSSTALVARQVRLEDAIAGRTMQLPGALGPPRRLPRRRAELAAAFTGSTLVEFVEIGDRLHAVTVHDGVSRLHPLGAVETARRLLPQLSFALRRLARPHSTPARQEAAAAALRKMQGELDELLFGPIRDRLGDRPLIVVPSAGLHGLPWAALPTCRQRSVSVVPSATLWLEAAARNRPAGDRIVVAAGPGLPGAAQEAAVVAAQYPGARCLVGEDATAERVAAAGDGADILHIAAHGRLRSDNPYFSSLQLADGPLTLYDLERIGAPGHVVLAACETAQATVVAVDEVLGFAAMLLAQGTTSLVAPVVTVVDEAVVDLMRDYHRQLLVGEPPAQALATAQSRAAGRGLAAWAAGAGFVCMGAGIRPVFLRLTP